MPTTTPNPADNFAEAIKRIIACREGRLDVLDLSGLDLPAVPGHIRHLKALKILHLSYNKLRTLPQEIDRLTALTTLNLSYNELETLPQEIGKLKALTMLDLSDNQLREFPQEIGKLTALTTLLLNDNQLETLPQEIDRLTALTMLYLNNNQLETLPQEIGKLTALTTLFLNNNQLHTLPQEIGKLKTLTTLLLDNNQLRALPQEIGKLTALTILSLSTNQLRTLPQEIGKLTALTTLFLNNNELRTLPLEIGQLSTLLELDLSTNKLTTLPTGIEQLTGLKELYLHNNFSLGIPASVLGPDINAVRGRSGRTLEVPERPSDILNFYFSQRLGEAQGTLKPLLEIKVMLVGRGGAGKTSLRRYFLNQPHNPSEPETRGIELNEIVLPYRGETITVRLWDFSGQEITHALHKFFLTEGCIYILVLDPRSDTELIDAFYWLKLLKRYAGHSPVVVALNRQDARDGGYDVDRYLLKERFRHIQDFIPTNCETRQGCDALRDGLLAAIEALSPNEPPRLKVPEAWVNIKQECFKQKISEVNKSVGSTNTQIAPEEQNARQRARRSHLTLEQFRQICRDNGEMTSESQESLARLLHRLGAVLHFVDDPRLRDTSVLDPHWVTDGVYRLLRYRDQPKSDGILTRDDLMRALPNEIEESARFLLRLMERFEMCFPLDEGDDGKLATRWLIPGALNKYQPATIGPEWQEPGSVRIRYVYDPLPEGVLPRFIVMTNLLSEGKPRWRNGVVLQDGEAAALVRRGEKFDHVEIIAFGPDAERLRLLQIIQGNMDRINADVPEPTPYLEQEIAGHTGAYKRVSELKIAERAEAPVVVESSQSVEVVAPTPELNRVSEAESRDPGRVPLNTFLSYAHDDRRDKRLFDINMTIMKSKNLIAPWHDGLIEPGVRWREEIENKLESMDLFVGLLTNNFVASEFIQKVELKSAKKKLQQQGKGFLFVLILVDDIPLEGLDLAEYQLLIPAGKAVSKHRTKKEGFIEAQRVLEKLLMKRQGGKGESNQPRRLQ